MKPYYRPETYSMANSVGYLMRMCSSRMRARAEALFAHEELTFSQWTTLVALHDGRLKTAGDLAYNICHDAGSLTRLIDQLAERKLVTRARSQTDRRVVTLALTARGRALVEKLAPRMMDLSNELLAGFSHAEVDSLIACLTRLLVAMEEPQPDGRPSRLLVSDTPIASPLSKTSCRKEKKS